MIRRMLAVFGAVLFLTSNLAAEKVKIGLNYPRTGPYYVQGADQWDGTEFAVNDINSSGGILGQQIEIVSRDSQSKPDVSTNNALELIKEGVKMIFGGSASSVAIAVGKVCQAHGVPFFGTLTYSTETTGEEGHRHTFRVCYDSWAAAKVLSKYLNKNFAGKKYFYVSADYTWGRTTEAAFRELTKTTDANVHKRVLTKFPGAAEADFKAAITAAREANPDVLVLVEFGNDMVVAVREAFAQGLKGKTQIVVPNLPSDMARAAGPKAMEGVLGTIDWFWQLPGTKNYPEGRAFVEKFDTKTGRHPGASAAYVWTILHQYKAAVERANSFDSSKVIKALEGYKFTSLAGEEYWRAFDHQAIKTVYAVRCKPEEEVVKDKFKADFFQIIDELPGDQAFKTRAEWNKARTAAGKPEKLEDLPD